MNKIAKIYVSFEGESIPEGVSAWKSVRDEVERTSHYLASGSEDFVRVALQGSDNELLRQWWSDASAVVMAAIGRYATSYAIDSTSVTITISLPMWCVDGVENVLVAIIADYYTNYILSRWLGIVLPDQAATYASMSQANVAELTNIINQRKQPSPNDFD